MPGTRIPKPYRTPGAATETVTAKRKADLETLIPASFIQASNHKVLGNVGHTWFYATLVLDHSRSNGTDLVFPF